MLKLSSRARAIPQALSVQINQMVYEAKRNGRDIITLSLGEAFFDIPDFPFDWTCGYHYSDSQGIPQLRGKIAEYYRRYNCEISPENIIISAGSKPLIFMVMQAVLDPGDIVAVHEPAWLSYQEQARLCGAKVRFIPYAVPVTEFFHYLDTKVKLFVINNPNNPSGRIYTRNELLMIYEHCRFQGIWLLIDEAYSDFVLDDSFQSLAGLSGVIVVNSLSKNMGMSGWRIGYAITPQAHPGPAVLSSLLKINQHIITCAPTVLLHYLAKYFDRILSHTLPQVRAVVEKRARVAEMLGHHGIRYLPGSSTFYFFLETGHHDGNELCSYLLLRHNIALVPGRAYGASTERFMRMSIGTESEERINRAIKQVSKHVGIS